MYSNLEERILQFVADKSTVEKASLRLDTTLAGDLGIAGDDGCELMEEFGCEFDVDLAHFVPSSYFGTESGCCPPVALFILLRWWVCGHSHDASGLLPISIMDLVRAAEEKHW